MELVHRADSQSQSNGPQESFVKRKAGGWDAGLSAKSPEKEEAQNRVLDEMRDLVRNFEGRLLAEVRD